MNRTVLFCCFLFVATVLGRDALDKYGILYVNELVANSDTNTVKIEQSVVEDNILQVNILKTQNGNGVNSEGISLQGGGARVFDDFTVHPATTFPGRLNANGGIFAPAGLDDFSSFTVEDNTGKTTVHGLTHVVNGLFTKNNVFSVAPVTGETTISSAALNANGGVNVNQGAFTVSESGDTYSASTFSVLNTVFLGTTATEDRFVKRVTTSDQIGGSTFLGAQDGTVTGGDLFIVPGISSACVADVNGNRNCVDGSVFIGRQLNDNIRIARPTISGSGSSTTYNGQTSPNGDGGDINIFSGDSFAGGDGGDLVVVPGLSGNGNHGKILFGTTDPAFANYDLVVDRPHLASGNGGNTFFVGQNSKNGAAGDLHLLSGDGQNGAELNLVTGGASANVGTQGIVYLGDHIAADLVLDRVVSSGSGGETLFEGQNSASNKGGDLYLVAGQANGSGNGGDVILKPGEGSIPLNVNAGNIILGDQVRDLTIARPPRDTGGLGVIISGQTGVVARGGNLELFGGEGNTVGGDVQILGGEQTTGTVASGGDVVVEGGDGQLSGGNVVIAAGNLLSGNSGDISVQSDDGNIYLQAGSGETLGDVGVGDFSTSLLFENTPIVISNSRLILQNGAEQITFGADPTSILEYNGKTILRSVSDYLVPAVSIVPIGADPVLTDTALRLSELQNSIEILANALGQCQHGLFQTVSPSGQVDSCLAKTQ